MKDKFFKFFEINKLDKGLFRIWIILLIPYFAFGLYASTQIDDFQTFWEYKSFSSKNYDGYKEFCKELEIQGLMPVKYNITTGKYEIIGKPPKKLIKYGKTKSTTSLIASFGSDYYDTFDVCIVKTQELKSNAIKNISTMVFGFILFPFSIILIWLLSKKTIIWIYKGFK